MRRRDPAIRTESLSNRCGETLALARLDLTVELGEVYGFLGPNGEGKTTTLRMLFGLATPTTGYAVIFGKPYAELEQAALRVGTVLEATDFHPGRSGRDHLLTLSRAVELLRRFLGAPRADPRSRKGCMLRCCAAVAAALAVTAGAAAAAAPLPGRFTAALTKLQPPSLAGTWTLRLAASGGYSLTTNGAVVDSGSYTRRGGVLTVHDSSGPLHCPPAWAGRYGIAVTQTRLTLTLVADSCLTRARILAHAFRRNT